MKVTKQEKKKKMAELTATPKELTFVVGVEDDWQKVELVNNGVLRLGIKLKVTGQVGQFLAHPVYSTINGQGGRATVDICRQPGGRSGTENLLVQFAVDDTNTDDARQLFSHEEDYPHITVKLRTVEQGGRQPSTSTQLYTGDQGGGRQPSQADYGQPPRYSTRSTTTTTGNKPASSNQRSVYQ